MTTTADSLPAQPVQEAETAATSAPAANPVERDDSTLPTTSEQKEAEQSSTEAADKPAATARLNATKATVPGAKLTGRARNTVATRPSTLSARTAPLASTSRVSSVSSRPATTTPASSTGVRKPSSLTMPTAASRARLSTVASAAKGSESARPTARPSSASSQTSTVSKPAGSAPLRTSLRTSTTPAVPRPRIVDTSKPSLRPVAPRSVALSGSARSSLASSTRPVSNGTTTDTKLKETLAKLEDAQKLQSEAEAARDAKEEALATAQDDLKKLELELKALQEAKDSELALVHDLRTETDGLKTQLAEAQAQAEEAVSAKESTLARLNDLERELAGQRKAGDNLRSQVAQLEASLSEAQQDMEHALASLRKEHDTKVGDMQASHDSALAQLRDEHGRQTKDISSQQASLRSAHEAALADAQRQHETTLETLRAKLAETEKQLAEVQERQASNDDSQQVLEQLKRDHAAALAKHEESTEQSRRELQEAHDVKLSTDKTAFEARLKALDLEVSETKRDLAERQQLVDKLERELAEARESTAAVAASATQSEPPEDVESIKQELESVKQELSESKTALERTQEDLSIQLDTMNKIHQQELDLAREDKQNSLNQLESKLSTAQVSHKAALLALHERIESLEAEQGRARSAAGSAPGTPNRSGSQSATSPQSVKSPGRNDDLADLHAAHSKKLGEVEKAAQETIEQLSNELARARQQIDELRAT